MRSLRNLVRFLVAVQLLPALESGEETLVGGQAVLEGRNDAFAARLGHRVPQTVGRSGHPEPTFGPPVGETQMDGMADHSGCDDARLCYVARLPRPPIFRECRH